jgi:hypothetical protein
VQLRLALGEAAVAGLGVLYFAKILRKVQKDVSDESGTGGR